jgi:hypothetical protein
MAHIFMHLQVPTYLPHIFYATLYFYARSVPSNPSDKIDEKGARRQNALIETLSNPSDKIDEKGARRQNALIETLSHEALMHNMSQTLSEQQVN